MTRNRMIATALVVLIGVLTAGVAYDSFSLFSLSARALTLAQEIQTQRSTAILSACQDQNERHRETVRELDRILRRAERKVPPSRRAQIQESRAATLLLIDALAPHRNCRLVLTLALGGRPQ